MVRRAAAFRLGKFADTVEPEIVSKEIIPLFQELTQDGMLHSASQVQHDSVHLSRITVVGAECADCRSGLSPFAGCRDLWPSSTPTQ